MRADVEFFEYIKKRLDNAQKSEKRYADMVRENFKHSYTMGMVSAYKELLMLLEVGQ